MSSDDATDSFDALHPAIQHHVVNSLGWRTLRPLQASTIEPILAGEHVLAVAPTAGGKTEAAVLPLLSRMLSENWHGLTVLYVCPLRALLNDLSNRLSGYAELVGRRVGLWHGDTSAGERKRLLTDPPDVLLTTPESLESMLVSTAVAHEVWFTNLRVVVIDEAHVFGSDDRGWHLLAVLERVARLAGRDLQRIALSATVGNPDDLLAWLTRTSQAPARVVSQPVAAAVSGEVTLDYVGSLANAALVISRLHRGEKRLAFVDSRARSEQLALALRKHEVTAFVSHGSLGAGERRAAEQAFAEERNCVIVATSTLELGIDVGDLDRVIQIDSPPTVSAFLQRLGRSGRRADTTRNALLLATDDDALLRSAAVLLRWSEGYIEPTCAPPMPLHLVAQQLLALSLQERGIGRRTWSEWLGTPFVLGEDAFTALGEITDHLVQSNFLVDDGGVLGIGGEAEAQLGRRHFMELLAVFTSPPMFSVRHGRDEIGVVPDETLTARPAGLASGGAHAIVLAGRNWEITHIDWPRRVVQVEPTDAPGIARWSGSGQPLGSAIARGVRDVLTGVQAIGVTYGNRAVVRLAELRTEHQWARPGVTTLLHDDRGRTTWWTFAGWKANAALASLVAELRQDVAAIDDLSIALDPGTVLHDLSALIAGEDTPFPSPSAIVTPDAVKGLKFSECLPETLAERVVAQRIADDVSVALARREPVAAWHDA